MVSNLLKGIAYKPLGVRLGRGLWDEGLLGKKKGLHVCACMRTSDTLTKRFFDLCNEELNTSVTLFRRNFYFKSVLQDTIMILISKVLQ